MKRFLVIAMLLLMMAGCCNTRPLSQQHTVTDTTYVEKVITVRDTIIQYEGATATAEVDCDSLIKALSKDFKTPFDTSSKAVISRKNHATLTAQLVNGQLQFAANCDSLEKEIQLRDTLLKEFRQRNETTITEVPVKFIPAFVKWLAIFGATCAVFMLGALFFKIKSFIP